MANFEDSIDPTQAHENAMRVLEEAGIYLYLVRLIALLVAAIRYTDHSYRSPWQQHHTLLIATGRTSRTMHPT